jgi:hypothetical protein
LATYTASLTASSFTMMSFSPISSIVAEVYEVTPMIVDSCVVVFLMSFVLFNFVSVYALENLGLKTTVSSTIIIHHFLYSLKYVLLGKYFAHG